MTKLEEAVLTHMRFIYYLINLYNIPQDDQEEIAQAFITQLLARGGNYNPKLKFTTYAGLAFKNFMIDQKRFGKNKVIRKSVSVETLAYDITPIDVGFTSIETKITIQNLVLQLPPLQQQIVILHFYEGVEIRVIAKRFKASETNIHRLLKEAYFFMKSRVT